MAKSAKKRAISGNGVKKVSPARAKIGAKNYEILKSFARQGK